jgi:hypothetical protein
MESRVKRSASVVHREVAGESVLLDLERDRYFALNEVGTAIWRLLEEGPRLADVLAELARTFDAPPELIQEDLVALIRELRTNGLVEVSG